MLTFQELIEALNRYWAGQGCLLLQPYDLEVGAARAQLEDRAQAVGTAVLCRAVQESVAAQRGFNWGTMIPTLRANKRGTFNAGGNYHAVRGTKP